MGPNTKELSGMRFLVVEDDYAASLLTQKTLRDHGAALVVEASNGIEALNKAQETEYDVIFMDLNLPELGGIEATARIRRAGIKTPIVALTASSSPDLAFRAGQAGCTAYLVKSWKGPARKASWEALTSLKTRVTNSAIKFGGTSLGSSLLN